MEILKYTRLFGQNRKKAIMKITSVDVYMQDYNLGGFVTGGYGTNAGFLRSKIRLAGKGGRGI